LEVGSWKLGVRSWELGVESEELINAQCPIPQSQIVNILYKENLDKTTTLAKNKMRRY
jgi:hypothetical protein